MKKISIMAGIVLFAGFLPPVVQRASAQVNVSFQLFYDQLSPFGSWVSYPDYGYVWVPGAGAGFRPYSTRGHWVYTEDGWTWVSDYSWGWATFHYGNWFYDDVYGWMWVPGYEWAPAWVTWGSSGGYYCWAPIGPRVDIGVSYGTYRPPAGYWNICPRERITSVNVSNYYVRNVHNTTVINNITVINNVNRGNGHAYLRGPQANDVERFTHTTVRPVAIRSAERPGAAAVRNGQLAIYRPAVQNNNASARPAQVRDLHALRPVNNRPAAAQRPGQQPNPGIQPRPDARTQPRINPATQPGQVHPSNPGRTPAQQPHPTPGERPAQRSPVQNPPVQHPPVRQYRVQPRPNPAPRPMPQQARPARPATPPPHGEHQR